ncbi:uncharacterized protein LOC136086588 [Hydra vulgaris]|uniref:Uncharacterized protein LOC136086588 n=1 Tax=Hydra vulgaris TaxID=6087 RepID=A0ABM4CSK3_HYDVU
MVLDLVDIDRFGGGEADSIVKGINNIFETGEFKLESNDYKKKLVSITSDGVSVNFGKYRVIAQIKADRESLLPVHCVNHRVQLAVKEVFSEISKLKKVDEFYNTNFYLLRNSGKIKQEVINASAALGTTHYTLPKLTGTRFVGHHIRAFKNLLESWPVYIVAYENYVNEWKNPITTKAKVQGLLKKFKSYNFLCTVAVYHDMLELIVPASKVFVANKLLPHDILATINRTNLELELKLEEIDTDLEFLDSYVSRYIVIEGKHNLSETMSGQFSKAGDKRKHPSNRKYIIVNLDMTLVDVDQALCLVRSIKRKVITRLINTLNSRFTSIKEESEIYHAMWLIDPQNWTDNKEFGLEEIKFLSTHFKTPLEHSNFNEKLVFQE